MRGFSWKEYLKRPCRFPSTGCVPGGLILKHNAAVYQRPGDSLKLSDGDKKVDHLVCFSSVNGDEYRTEFTFVPRPMEPSDVDEIVRCPPPEPCIVHDGIIFKDRLPNSWRRGTDLLGSMREMDHSVEFFSTSPKRRINRSSQELLQSPALIAPDLVATKIID